MARRANRAPGPSLSTPLHLPTAPPRSNTTNIPKHQHASKGLDATKTTSNLSETIRPLTAEVSGDVLYGVRSYRRYNQIIPLNTVYIGLHYGLNMFITYNTKVGYLIMKV